MLHQHLVCCLDLFKLCLSNSLGSSIWVLVGVPLQNTKKGASACTFSRMSPIVAHAVATFETLSPQSAATAWLLGLLCR